MTIEWRTGVALPVLVAVVAIYIAGLLYFCHAPTVNPLKPETASDLVCSGVYRYSRNPMYLGSATGLIAWSNFLAWPPARSGVSGFVVYMNLFQTGPEERALASHFGKELTQY